MNKPAKLTGIIPPIGTPLTAEENVDIAGLRRLTRYLVQSGVDGVFVNGTMGIFALLSDSEQLRAIETVIEEVDGAVPVVAGVSDTGTRRVIENIRLVQNLGVDYLTALPPFYYMLTQDSACRFFRDVAEAAVKPFFIYNNQFFTKFNLSIESILKLSEHVNIAGIKETNPDCSRWAQLARALGTRPDFSVLIGTELLPHVASMLGADGIIAGSHNVCAPLAVDIYRSLKARDFTRASELTERLRRLTRIFEYGEIWGAFEVALNYLGICDKATARPYVSLGPEERAQVETILSDCGIVKNSGVVEAKHSGV